MSLGASGDAGTNWAFLPRERVWEPGRGASVCDVRVGASQGPQALVRVYGASSEEKPLEGHTAARGCANPATPGEGLLLQPCGAENAPEQSRGAQPTPSGRPDPRLHTVF